MNDYRRLSLSNICIQLKIYIRLTELRKAMAKTQEKSHHCGYTSGFLLGILQRDKNFIGSMVQKHETLMLTVVTVQ